jgi:hypothetical protein
MTLCSSARSLLVITMLFHMAHGTHNQLPQQISEHAPSPSVNQTLSTNLKNYWPHVVLAAALATALYIHYRSNGATTFWPENEPIVQDYEKITVTQAFEKIRPVFDFMAELIKENKDLKTQLTYVLQSVEDPDVQKTKTLGEHVKTINKKLAEFDKLKKQK